MLCLVSFVTPFQNQFLLIPSHFLLVLALIFILVLTGGGGSG